MSHTTAPEAMTSYDGHDHGGRMGRRQRVYGYLKAANEIRQSYQSQWQQRYDDPLADERGMSQAFPDVEIVRSGDEEMILFPSYARQHIKSEPKPRPAPEIPGNPDDLDRPAITGDGEYARDRWEQYEEDDAVVDVDVRGWIYTPHRGAISRKNRLLIAVARKLSGIPAPAPSPAYSRSSSRHREGSDDQTSRREDEAATNAAQKLVERGEGEAKIAWRGEYSEEPHAPSDRGTPTGSKVGSPRHSPEIFPLQSRGSLTDSEAGSGDEDPGQRALIKRTSWNQPGVMSQEELIMANAHLMARLKPFMSTPLISTPITVFFFNDEQSQSRTVDTNDSGHFMLRAALDFVPHSVRVLASETLSATEKVDVTDVRGVSLVSDIDDTIKHSAIASGAREIFKNTFIRELGDLTIQGVKEWYTKMADMGVKMHYVSNSPWQLYPLLRSYFALAGLPKGSFHLKQYSGMLQGIFEPAAERKKGSLERIMRDFPERRFVLVGDSGEADLEVYTDIVLAYPGRVLGVFIRDVTTPEKKGFFDQHFSSTQPGSQGGRRRNAYSDESDKTEHVPPPLPTRSKPSDVLTGDLIDLSDEPEKIEPRRSSYGDELFLLDQDENIGPKAMPPNRPLKPSSLRAVTATPQSPAANTQHGSNLAHRGVKSPPPKPRRPSHSVHLPPAKAPVHSNTLPPRPTSPPIPAREKEPPPTLSIRSSSYTSLRSLRAKTHTQTPTSNTVVASSYPSGEDEGYVASARRQLASIAPGTQPKPRSNSPSRTTTESDPHRSSARPTQPRRGLTSYPAAAARYVTGASGGDPAAGGDGGAGALSSYSKKEEMWRRRWARSEEIMRSRGVVLKLWRVGSDVSDMCVALVEKALKEMEEENKPAEEREDEGHINGEIGRK